MFEKLKTELISLEIVLIKKKSGVIKLFDVGGKQIFFEKRKKKHRYSR